MRPMALHEISGRAPIKIRPSRKGLLHKKQGEKIPASKVAAAKKSSSPALRKEATFAQNAVKWRA